MFKNIFQFSVAFSISVIFFSLHLQAMCCTVQDTVGNSGFMETDAARNVAFLKET